MFTKNDLSLLIESMLSLCTSVDLVMAVIATKGGSMNSARVMRATSISGVEVQFIEEPLGMATLRFEVFVTVGPVEPVWQSARFLKGDTTASSSSSSSSSIPKNEIPYCHFVAMEVGVADKLNDKGFSSEVMSCSSFLILAGKLPEGPKLVFVICHPKSICGCRLKVNQEVGIKVVHGGN
jgi:hypothetical protein